MLASVAVVDDHPILLSGIVQLFEEDGNFRVVARAGTADAAVEIADKFAPDVVLLDLSLPGDAIAAIGKISEQRNPTKVVAFTACTSIEVAIRALQAGASGYILKGSDIDEVLRGMRAVMAGEIFITQGFATKVIATLTSNAARKQEGSGARLSIREDQVVRLLLQGRTNKEIAHTLGISEKTIKKYMTVLMQKLQARNRLEVVIAVQRLASQLSWSGDGLPRRQH
jgi:DNA-binding NarL/FixJ family response regulator